MICVIVSSWSCFCWPYRASPSLVAKNIINLISVLTIWWCPCVESCVVGRGCLLWPVCSLGKLLAIALLHSVLQGQICLLLQVFLDFLLLHSSPLSWKGHLFGVLVLEGLVGLHRTVQLQVLQRCWSGHWLGLLWYWMVCLGNKQRSFCCFWDCIQVLHFRLFCWLWLPGDNGDLLQKVSWRHWYTQCPQPCGQPLLTHTSAAGSWTLMGNSGSVSCGVTAPFHWVLMHTRFSSCPPMCTSLDGL